MAPTILVARIAVRDDDKEEFNTGPTIPHITDLTGSEQTVREEIDAERNVISIQARASMQTGNLQEGDASGSGLPREENLKTV